MIRLPVKTARRNNFTPRPKGSKGRKLHHFSQSTHVAWPTWPVFPGGATGLELVGETEGLIAEHFGGNWKLKTPEKFAPQVPGDLSWLWAASKLTAFNKHSRFSECPDCPTQNSALKRRRTNAGSPAFKVRQNPSFFRSFWEFLLLVCQLTNQSN